jgi:V8-like Glu-specific endopeptidase
MFSLSRILKWPSDIYAKVMENFRDFAAREPITSVDPGSPYAAICWLKGTYANFPDIRYATGFLVDDNTVITAAHFLSETVGGQSLTKITGSVGTLGAGFQGRGQFESTRFVYDGRFDLAEFDKTRCYDYGAVFLDSPIPDGPVFDIDTWAPIPPDQFQPQTQLQCAGYAASSSFALEKSLGLACAGAQAFDANKQVLRNLLDLDDGFSGAPVFVEDQDHAFRVIAINSGWLPKLTGQPTICGAVYITTDVRDLLKKWRSEQPTGAYVPPQTIMV